jgi:hypothetical protein
MNAVHRHLSNIDCLMARTACLVCFISTVNGRSKKGLYRLVLVAGTPQTLSNLFFTFDVYDAVATNDVIYISIECS